jgi:hypothetical chaperone protein
VAAYLRFLVDGARQVLGEPITEVVVGRPVRFHADPEKNRLALNRLTDAVEQAGLPEPTFQLEPVAAALRYELGLDRDRIVLVGDFGGGTSDFALLRAGPERATRADRLGDVLATTGVAQAGDALDARFMETFLLDAFGRGSPVRRLYSETYEPWDHPVHRQILRLYSLPMIRSRELEEGLTKIEPFLADRAVVRRLRRLIFDDLGYPLAWAIERSKREFSASETTTFRFDEFHSPALDLERPVARGRFAEGSADLLGDYDEAIAQALADAGLTEADVDDVFLTGGTSQLPFIQDLFAARFGRERLHGGEAFTSVCEGLALTAAVAG